MRCLVGFIGYVLLSAPLAVLAGLGILPGMLPDAAAAVPPAAPADKPPLEAGLAVKDITPPTGFRMSGYFYERLSTGTHDPLMAKALVLHQGDCRAGMVVCDLIGIPFELSKHVREQAEQKLGIPAGNILIAATHTHTGPLYAGALRTYFHQQAIAREGRDPCETVDYAALLAERLLAALAEAQAALAPAALHAGTAEQEGLSFNRRFHMKDGTVRFNPGKLNPDIVRPAGPVDPQVGLLLLRRSADGQPLGALTVFALHLDTVGGTEYSADFPYYLSERLQQQWGQQFVSLFANGTCGDLNHIDVSHSRPQKGQEEAGRIGRTLGATVARRLPELPLVAPPDLAVRWRMVEVPLQQYTAEELAWAQEAIAQVGTRGLPFLEQVRAYKILDLHARGTQTLAMPVQVFRFGAEVALVALPGEVFVDLGLQIKRRSPFALTMVVELAHDAPGYVPTRKAFAEGSYETVNSRVQPGGGELLVEAAVELLKQLQADCSPDY